MSSEELNCKTKKEIVEVANINVRFKRTIFFSRWDEWIQGQWKYLKRSVIPTQARKIDRRMIVWKCPKLYRWKLNIDGATKGNPGPTGIDCIIKDWNGKCVWVASKRMGWATNNEAKFESLMLGLRVCKEKNICIVDIKGDSQICVQAMMRGETLN
ncbi:hypothetical protein SUGI_0055210 [Cryptomeria japonica]|nr:hypothetical protein SUGI_0055210 [Cryptomeria japonica]